MCRLDVKTITTIHQKVSVLYFNLTSVVRKYLALKINTVKKTLQNTKLTTTQY